METNKTKPSVIIHYSAGLEPTISTEDYSAKVEVVGSSPAECGTKFLPNF